MADDKKTAAAKPASNATVIRPPGKVFRWTDKNTVSGKLTAPIVCVEEKFGKRTRIALETADGGATVLLPSRYATPYKDVPVNSMVTIEKSGQGRDTEYLLSYV